MQSVDKIGIICAECVAARAAGEAHWFLFNLERLGYAWLFGDR